MSAPRLQFVVGVFRNIMLILMKLKKAAEMISHLCCNF